MRALTPISLHKGKFITPNRKLQIKKVLVSYGTLGRSKLLARFFPFLKGAILAPKNFALLP
jgi:hypothetical protein